jgi:DNA ligase-associated metallophosphoesterase
VNQVRAIATIEVAGERVDLLPERAAWWPGARTLLVADLHLGKEHAAVGMGVPGTVLEETLTRLAGCIAETGADRVIIVGDLLHAALGTTPEVVDRVAAWRRGIGADLVLVAGNHDRGIKAVAAEWAITLSGTVLIDGPMRFIHDPDDGVADVYTWAGHLHPAVRVSAGRDSLRLPCFRVGERVGVLPAFSMFTGGSTSLFRGGDQSWAIAEGRVFRAPSRMPRPG